MRQRRGCGARAVDALEQRGFDAGGQLCGGAVPASSATTGQRCREQREHDHRRNGEHHPPTRPSSPRERSLAQMTKPGEPAAAQLRCRSAQLAAREARERGEGGATRPCRIGSALGTGRPPARDDLGSPRGLGRLRRGEPRVFKLHTDGDRARPRLGSLHVPDRQTGDLELVAEHRGVVDSALTEITEADRVAAGGAEYLQQTRLLLVQWTNRHGPVFEALRVDAHRLSSSTRALLAQAANRRRNRRRDTRAREPARLARRTPLAGTRGANARPRCAALVPRC